jgi:RNA polymerase sigma factor (sigma-70 family)
MVEPLVNADTALVRRAKAGDDGAFAEIVRLHQDRLFRTAMAISRNAADADDAVSRGLHKAYRALGRFREEDPIRPWLVTIVANEARSHRRSLLRRDRATLRFVAELDAGASAPSVDETVISTSERRRLIAAIDGLPTPAREVITCRYLLDLTEAETATAINTPIGTVKSRTARALAALRDQLEGMEQ